MDLISLTIDGVQVEVAPGTTVLEAARQAGIRIPTLCYLKDINEIGACRMCVVDTGARALQAACVLPVAPNMKVKTNTPAVRAARKMNLELLLSNHDRKCLSCVRSTTCELQAMCLEYGVDNEDAFAGSRTDTRWTIPRPPSYAIRASAYCAAAASPCAIRCRTSALSAWCTAASTALYSPRGITRWVLPRASTAASA